MTTDTHLVVPTNVPSPQINGRRRRSWLWPGIGVAMVGLVAGVAIGVTSYQSSQREIDGFARLSLPGTVAVQVEEAGHQVVYYEGDQKNIGSLTIAVTGPDGNAVTASPYEGELIYETADLTLGRAIASFDAAQAGAYDVEATGTDIGRVTVGESVARLALPGVLAGLAIAGLSLVAGFTLWLVSILRR